MNVGYIRYPHLTRSIDRKLAIEIVRAGTERIFRVIRMAIPPRVLTAKSYTFHILTDYINSNRLMAGLDIGCDTEPPSRRIDLLNLTLQCFTVLLSHVMVASFRVIIRSRGDA